VVDLLSSDVAVDQRQAFSCGQIERTRVSASRSVPSSFMAQGRAPADGNIAAVGAS
jgi:hypothetical protein